MAKTTLDKAAQKYEDKIPSMRTNYQAGVNAFLGADVSNSVPVKSYMRNIIPGKGADYKNGVKKAYGLA